MIGTGEQFALARGLSRKHVSIGVVVAFVVAVALVGPSATGLELVRDGKPLASIIIPMEPLAVESYAAKELQYHVESASGGELPIVMENQQMPAGAIFISGAARRRRRRRSIPQAFRGIATS